MLLHQKSGPVESFYYFFLSTFMYLYSVLIITSWYMDHGLSYYCIDGKTKKPHWLVVKVKWLGQSWTKIQIFLSSLPLGSLVFCKTNVTPTRKMRCLLQKQRICPFSPWKEEEIIHHVRLGKFMNLISERNFELLFYMRLLVQCPRPLFSI